MNIGSEIDRSGRIVQFLQQPQDAGLRCHWQCDVDEVDVMGFHVLGELAQ